MTKNELTRLLGFDALMKRNSKSKAFKTMLDILCDFLVITKEATNGTGVTMPSLLEKKAINTNLNYGNRP